MKEKITKAEFINTWASEWDENTGWKINEDFHKQFSEELEQLIDAEVEKRIAERMPSEMEFTQMVAGHIPWAIKPMRRSKTQFVNPFTSGNAFEQVISILSENLYKELRSRLTKPGAETSQKTEGGEG